MHERGRTACSQNASAPQRICDRARARRAGTTRYAGTCSERQRPESKRERTSGWSSRKAATTPRSPSAAPSIAGACWAEAACQVACCRRTAASARHAAMHRTSAPNRQSSFWGRQASSAGSGAHAARAGLQSTCVLRRQHAARGRGVCGRRWVRGLPLEQLGQSLDGSCGRHDTHGACSHDATSLDTTCLLALDPRA